jgi:hypothetical protein
MNIKKMLLWELIKPIIYYSIVLIAAFTLLIILFIGLANILNPDYAQEKHLIISLNMILISVKYGLSIGAMGGFFIGIFSWIIEIRAQKRLKSLYRNNELEKTPGIMIGAKYYNEDKKLPVVDNYGNPITYKVFDTHDNIPGQERDKERYIIGSNGMDNGYTLWITNDHYDHFYKIEKDFENRLRGIFFRAISK